MWLGLIGRKFNAVLRKKIIKLHQRDSFVSVDKR